MRVCIAPSAVVCLLWAQASLAAQEFPYTIVAMDRAPLRASANETNEPTTYLPGGTKLDVYRQDGSFLAVRPPEGSFSWVRASDVEATGDADIVRVAASDSQAWVGHQGTDLRAISQVQLQAGEKLRVLGAVASPNNPAQAAWYQVAPPAGEFRFILAQHAMMADAPAPPVATSPTPELKFTAWSKPAENSAIAPPVQTPVSGDSNELPVQASRPYLQEVMPLVAKDPVGERLKQIDVQLAAMLSQPPSTWNTAPLYTELQTLTSTAPTAEQRSQAQNLWWRVAKCQQVQQGYAQVSTPTTAAARTLTTASAAPVTATTASVSPTNFAATVNPATGQPLVQPTPQTEFQPLVARFKELAGQLNSSMQQQRTYTSTLRDRSAASTPGAAATGSATRSVLASTVAEVPAPDPVAEVGGYAGTGWLMPLVNRSQLSRDGRSGVPPYALTDDEGNVKFLITPTPGLSVSEYARKKVGVIGPVGQLPNLTNPHLTAERIVVLDRHE